MWENCKHLASSSSDISISHSHHSLLQSRNSPMNVKPNFHRHPLSSSLVPLPLPPIRISNLRSPPLLPIQIRCCSNSTKSPKPPRSSPFFSFLTAIPDWSDAIKERGMRRQRRLYTAADWREHRSSRRHMRHVISSLSSRVIISLVPPVFFFTAFAASVAAYNFSVASGWAPPWLPLLRASPLPYQLTAPALALLLVFRTEASYGRYVEGRKTWARIMAGTTELAMSVMALKVTKGSDYGIKKALLNYILAFPLALKCHVISNSNAYVELQGLLEKNDLEVVLESNHRPRCIISFISQALQILQMEGAKRDILEAKVSCFHDGIGICEQLIGIPIPLSYTRLTSRFLVFWHLTLPFILWDDCNLIVVPATFISAASLFCIEEVGVLIEEPFPMLALDDMLHQFQDSIQEALTIEKSIKGCVLAKTKENVEFDSTNGWPGS